MRMKMVIALVAFMGLICVCCKDNKVIQDNAQVVENVDTLSVMVDSTNVVAVDTLVVE